jgi:putative addiction module component (TIGR02574 family)
MKSDLEKITETALKLSSEARARLAEILMESLGYEEDFPVSEEWMKEIHRRCLEIDNGEVKLIAGESALEQLQKKYS